VRWTEHDSAGNLVVPANDLPAIIPILIGETLYNLRGALDYLVSQCFYLATGKFSSQPKFLIEDSIKGWKRHLAHGKKTRNWLSSLSAKHRASFGRLQPFNGCKWTKTLQIYSNIDKHRHFLVAKGGPGTGTIIRAPADWRPGSKVPKLSPEATMKIKRDRARTVLFDDGTSVIETLVEIHERVSAVIASFEPDFK